MTTETPYPSLLAAKKLATLQFFGLAEYGEILRTQERLRAERKDDRISDIWLAGEHFLVITQGIRAGGEDLLDRGSIPTAPVFQIDRGGLTTIHNPGQLIVYPIVRLAGGSTGAGEFSRALLGAMRIWVEQRFGLATEVRAGHPGLFAEGRKLLSIGISVRQSVTMHGVALNLSNDLSPWKKIVACGEPGIEPISVSRLLDRRVDPPEQMESLREWLMATWGYERVNLQNSP